MSSIVDQPAAPVSLRDRLARHEKLLGVLVDGSSAATAAVAGLEFDFVAVAGVVASSTAATLAAAARPLVLLVDEERETSDASLGPVTLARADTSIAADIVLSNDGPARIVTSADAARAAFASGADVVVYDAVAMIDDLFATLLSGRPEPVIPTRREPLVMLSGMLGDSHLWDDVAAALADAAVPWPARIDLDDSVAEMALSVLAEAPPHFALAGHSLGGIVALEIMRQAPERVTRLALVNASARGPVDAQLGAWALMRQRTETGEFDRVTAELARSTLAEANRDEHLVARNERMAHSVGAAGFLCQLAAQVTRPDSRAGLAAISVPVLVLSGELDEICPPALQEELAQLCPRARLETIAAAGHMSPLERPSAVADALRRWLLETDDRPDEPRQ